MNDFSSIVSNAKGALSNTAKKIESIDTQKLLNATKKQFITPTYEEIIKYNELFQKNNLKTKFVPAILMYLKLQKLDINYTNAKHVYSQLNFNTIKMEILYRFYLDKPTSDNEINSLKVKMKRGSYKAIDVEIASCYYLLDIEEKNSTNTSSGNLKKVIDDLRNDSESENIIAIKMLIDELENKFSKLFRLDIKFLERIVSERPLIALVMLTKLKLNKVIVRDYKESLLQYIENEEVYKLLVPFIHIYTGKTHGQWRHISDPSKQCIVLVSKNCKIASPKNTQKSYDKSETEGKFLVLQGLSILAESDNAEVHYFEV